MCLNTKVSGVEADHNSWRNTFSSVPRLHRKLCSCYTEQRASTACSGVSFCFVECCVDILPVFFHTGTQYAGGFSLKENCWVKSGFAIIVFSESWAFYSSLEYSGWLPTRFRKTALCWPAFDHKKTCMSAIRAGNSIIFRIDIYM